jgi:regulator of Ty1 transposition protein 103
MPEAAQTAYRSSTTEIQQKIRRLIEVWRVRNVFEIPIQDAIEARLNDIDKTRPTGKKPLMGGSLFGSSSGSGGLSKELESLAPLQLAVSKANLSTTSTTNTTNAEYDKLNDPNAQLPAPPLHAARLSALLKSLATAESSVAESVKARKALISELEKILETNRTSLSKDETTLTDLQNRRTSTETKRRDVEDNIRRTANADPDGMYNNNNNNGAGPESFIAGENEMDRPEYEALTPPPVDALTPPLGSPKGDPLREPQPAANTERESDRNPDVQNLLASMSSAGASIPPRMRPSSHAHAGMGMGTGTTGTNGFGSSGIGIGIGNSSKKRKVSHHQGSGGGELPPGFGLDLDEDVAEMIRQESGGGGGGGMG